MAKTCGQHLLPFLPDLLNCFAPYLTPDVPEEYRECALAAISAVAQDLENHFQPFAAAFIPVCLQNLANDLDTTVQEACLCLRQIFRYGQLSPQVLSEVWPAIEQKMQTNKEEHPGAFDCLFGLIARLLLTYPGVLPADQVSVVTGSASLFAIE